MVATRRSNGSAKKEKDDPLPAPESDNKEESEVAREESASGKRASARLLRQRVGEELRSKSTGVGVAITAGTTANKKIIFGDDDTVAIESAIDGPEVVQPTASEQTPLEADDSDDDAVEEVKGSAAAKNIELEQLAEEQATARAANLTKKTRKRKSKPDEVVDSSMLNDDFFRQVDQERAEESKKRKMKTSKVGEKGAGRHTTFVVSADGALDGVGSSLTPKAVGHNIEVVVLGSDSAVDGDSSLPLTGRSLLLEANTEAPSDEVLLYSRAGLLADGSVPLSTRQEQKIKKAGHKSAALKSVSTWKRSKKMRVVAYGTRNKATAAAQFVKKR